MKQHAGILLCLLMGASFLFSTSVPAGEKEIIVGGKNFTEQYLLAELAGILLEGAGFEVTLKTGVGSVIARKSLEHGQLDLYFEYTGTAYTVYYRQKNIEIMTDPERVYQWVKQADEDKGLIWLDPVQFNNTYTVMMKKTQADALEITSISDLARYVNSHPDELIFALESEFWERPDGFKQVMKTYGFRLPPAQVKKMSLGLTYQALKDGQVNSAMGFATDGRVAAFGFVNLVDDKSFFPVYNPVPVVRSAVLDAYPEIRHILRPIADTLSTEEMQKLNAAVDVAHRPVRETAMAWLKGKKLIN